MTFERRDVLQPFPIVMYVAKEPAIRITVSSAGMSVQTCGGAIVLSVEDCVAFEETLAKARVQAGHLSQDGAPLTDEQVDLILGPIPLYEESS